MKDRPRQETKTTKPPWKRNPPRKPESLTLSNRITSRADREKKLRTDDAERRANELCQRWLSSTDSGPARMLKPVFFGLCYAFPKKDDQAGSSFLVRMLKEALHTLAGSLPRLTYDTFTLMFLLTALAVAGIALGVTGNLWWFIFVGIGMLCFTGSTLCLKYGMTGWFLAMILFGAMLFFFMLPRMVLIGLPGLFRIFQLW